MSLSLVMDGKGSSSMKENNLQKGGLEHFQQVKPVISMKKPVFSSSLLWCNLCPVAINRHVGFN